MALFPKTGAWERDFAALNAKYWRTSRDLVLGGSANAVWQYLGLDKSLSLALAAMPPRGITALAALPAIVFKPRSVEFALMHASLIARGDSEPVTRGNAENVENAAVPTAIMELSLDYWRTIREFIRKDRVLGIALCQVPPVLADVVADLDNAQVDRLTVSPASSFVPRNMILASRMVSQVSAGAHPLAVARTHVGMLCAPSYLDEVA